MLSRIFAFLIWAACAAGLVYWGLRWLAKPMPVPPHSTSVTMSTIPKGDLNRILTAPETAASSAASVATEQSALAARIQLVGLMAAAGKGNGPGVALMALDGRPARAFRVGQKVDGDQVVLAITRQGVDIGLPDTSTTTRLPAQSLPPPATGTLPSAGNNTGMPPTPPSMPAALTGGPGGGMPNAASQRAGVVSSRPLGAPTP